MNKKSMIAFVIATKDRPEDLKNLLKSLVNQTFLPKEVVVVDGSDKPVKNLIQQYSNLNIKYLRILPPSATKQRNIGIKVADKSIPLIGFLDDDAILEENSIKKMVDFWDKAEKDIGGASFNMLNHPPLFASKIKKSFLSSKLNLYSDEKGKVPESGFQTVIDTVKELIYTDWLPSTASVWRREVLEKYWFDEWFKGYGYLEDVDFSYRVGKEWKLVVVPDAKYYHYPAETGRGNGFEFGEKEVINRIYFVRKHKELSVFFCALGITGRILISISGIIAKRQPLYYIKRIHGNIKGLIESF